jgi:hypothetical protein
MTSWKEAQRRVIPSDDCDVHRYAVSGNGKKAEELRFDCTVADRCFSKSSRCPTCNPILFESFLYMFVCPPNGERERDLKMEC